MKLSTIIVWLADCMYKIKDWCLETWYDLTEIFSNWDTQLNDFKNQIVTMSNQVTNTFSDIMGKLRQAGGEIKQLIHEFGKMFDIFK